MAFSSFSSAEETCFLKLEKVGPRTAYRAIVECCRKTAGLLGIGPIQLSV